MTNDGSEERIAPPPRVPALDGIRGVAILAVVAYHCQLFGRIGQTSVAGRLYQTVAAHGHYGVDLFFTLSGFLITGILCDSRGSASYFRTFYIRRALRIFPPYYVFLLLVAASLPWTTQAWLWSYLSNILIARESFEALPHALRHVWSLAVEEQFYLVWPFVVFVVRPRTLLTVCVATILASVALTTWLMVVTHQEVAAYVLTPTRADALAWGAAVAVAMRLTPGVLARVARYGWPICLGLAVAFVGIGIAGHGAVGYLCKWIVADLACAAALAGAATGMPDAWPQRVLSWSGLRAIGRWSYVMYLVQEPVAVVLSRSRIAPRVLAQALGSPLLALVVFTVIVTTVSAGIGWVSGATMERWLARVKDRVTYRGAHVVALSAARAAQ